MNFYSSKARKIGITNRSVSGTVPNIGAYESTLERDFMELNRFDDYLKEIIPQPVSIPYLTKNEKLSSYTPDGLLVYHDCWEVPPILYEIKYRNAFTGCWKDFMPKFRAARQFAFEKGWSFKIITEDQIRTTYLTNVKFLWPYKQRKFEEEILIHVLQIMSDLEEADPALLTAALFSSPKNQAQVIPVIWHLIANFKIGCDLQKPLNMHSKIWTKLDI